MLQPDRIKYQWGICITLGAQGIGWEFTDQPAAAKRIKRDLFYDGYIYSLDLVIDSLNKAMFQDPDEYFVWKLTQSK